MTRRQWERSAMYSNWSRATCFGQWQKWRKTSEMTPLYRFKHSYSINVKGACGDNKTDSFMQWCEYLALSEISMRDDEKPISIRNYQCVIRMNNCISSTTESVGVVAIYRQVFAKSTCVRDINVSNQSMHTRTLDDICLAEISIAMDEISLIFLVYTDLSQCRLGHSPCALRWFQHLYHRKIRIRALHDGHLQTRQQPKHTNSNNFGTYLPGYHIRPAHRRWDTALYIALLVLCPDSQ